MNELALASFAAARDVHLVGEPRSARFAAFKASFDGHAELARLRVRSGIASSPAPTRRSRRCSVRSTTRRRGSSSAATPTSSCSPGRPSRSSARAPAPPTAARSRAASAAISAAAGLVVVSGLARGIDAEAHRGALEAAGSTVAVLGCGIDRDYPAAHRELARQVAATGLVVSEYAPGVEPAPWRFPARNRIVAGLCAATVVVEARERSGALITADFALEEGREVFAVPGEITSALSAGVERAPAARRDAADLRPGRARELRHRRPGRRAGRRRADGRRRARARFAPALPAPTSSAARRGLSAGELAAVADRARARRRREGGGRCLPCCSASIAAWPTPSGSPRPLRRCRSRPLPAPADVEIVGGGVTGISARSRSRAWASACGCTRRARSPPARAAATAGLPSAAGRWHTTARASGSATTSLRTTGA